MRGCREVDPSGNRLIVRLAHPGDQRVRVAHLAEVAELLRVDDRADRLDLAVGDIEGEDTDQPPVEIQELGPGPTVHVHAAKLDADANRDLPPVAKHPGDLDPAEGGALDRGSEPAPIAVQLDVLREQSLERLELAVLGGSEEAVGEPLSKLDRGLEPGPALLDVPAGAGGELAGVALARPDDLGDLVVAVVEDVM